MSGKLIGIGLMIVALIGGAAMYWLQVHAFYERVELAPQDIRLTPMVTGTAEPIPAEAVEAIDAGSSPLRFRACFTTPLSQAMLTETYESYDAPEPLNAPGWFDCFDAAAIGQALAEGRALAFLGEKNVDYGVDRVVAIFDDGRGYVWHQLNDCGETAYDGTPVGEGCPPRPEAD